MENSFVKKSTDFAAELEVLKLKPLLYADKFICSLITSNAVGWYELFDVLFYITLCLLNQGPLD